ncbi:hypothetical protein [Pseudonocardia asaccharolytica]|uniref:Uncharacterized protein n=1 Tax=Pseudonocardia asaccharolytica DSM 44247 = NBRC 16224 TaxID=1123024 RepID=A0A511D3K6_9PSEU|nr:hypothetical protein [Pseudonocardia asaccharolytica]GEL19355.1 hypothetical protein PA7_31920 [Pseudonocardia asaccharolytica DSM 44247 = NBRC 16224]
MVAVAVAGRGPEARSVAGVVTTADTDTVTAPAGSFQAGDVGRAVTGAGIPDGTTVASVQSATAATLSTTATASGTVTVMLGAGAPAVYGFRGWAPESAAEAGTYSIAGGAGASAPDRITDPTTPITRRTRSS